MSAGLSSAPGSVARVGELTAIYRYPIKSCRGHQVSTAVVEPWGLAGDRRWMLVDALGEAVTARKVPRSLLVHPEPTESGLLVRAPGADPLAVTTPTTGETRRVTVFGNPLPAVEADDGASDWFSAVLDIPTTLVYLNDATRRRPKPDYSRPTDRVSFADGFPLLLATEESLAELNRLMLSESAHPGQPLSMTRFRPSVVVNGAPAWAEDRWRRLRIGDAVFRAVKGCDRCVLTTIDPDTGERGHEPLRILAKHRRWAGKVWFGVNLIPDTPGVSIRAGDPVEILEAEPTSIPPPAV
jgi:uncharacterized protein